MQYPSLFLKLFRLILEILANLARTCVHLHNPTSFDWALCFAYLDLNIAQQTRGMCETRDEHYRIIHVDSILNGV